MTKNEMLAEELMILSRNIVKGAPIDNPYMTAATLCIAANELRAKDNFVPEFIRKEEDKQ